MNEEELREALKEAHARYTAMEKNVAALLARVGDAGTCACDATIYWVRHIHTGKMSPYNPDGETHWATCPMAKDFRKRKKEKEEHAG